MPGGRPTKYRPEYCEQAIETMAEGTSMLSLAADIGVHIDTLYEWERVHAEFSAALKIARMKSAARWERLLIAHAETGQGSAATIIFGLKNRGRQEWRDKFPEDDPTPPAEQVIKIVRAGKD